MLSLSSSVMALHMARPPLHEKFLYPSSLRMQPPRCVETYDDRPPNPNHVAERLDLDAERRVEAAAAAAAHVPMTFWESPSEEYQRSGPTYIFGDHPVHVSQRRMGRRPNLFQHCDEFEELESPGGPYQGAAPADVGGGLLALAAKRKVFWASRDHRARAQDLMIGGKGAKKEPAREEPKGEKGAGRLTAAREAAAIIGAQGATLAGIVVALDREERGGGDTKLSAIQQVPSDIPSLSPAPCLPATPWLAAVHGRGHRHTSGAARTRTRACTEHAARACTGGAGAQDPSGLGGRPDAPHRLP